MTELDKFLQTVDDIYGLYLDSTNGCFQFRKSFIDDQNKVIQRGLVDNLSIEQMDRLSFGYGREDPNIKYDPVHKCTQGEFKKRNEKDGKNYKLLANLCLVMIYNYWEDYYRNRIREELGLKSVDSDIMGDLKYLRESIVHHRGIAIDIVKRCKILKWFNPGDEIIIDSEKFYQMICHIKLLINDFQTSLLEPK